MLELKLTLDMCCNSALAVPDAPGVNVERKMGCGLTSGCGDQARQWVAQELGTDGDEFKFRFRFMA